MAEWSAGSSTQRPSSRPSTRPPTGGSRAGRPLRCRARPTARWYRLDRQSSPGGFRPTVRTCSSASPTRRGPGTRHDRVTRTEEHPFVVGSAVVVIAVIAIAVFMWYLHRNERATLLAVDARTGSVLWRIHPHVNWLEIPSVDGGRVMVPGLTPHGHCGYQAARLTVDARTGAQLGRSAEQPAEQPTTRISATDAYRLNHPL